MTNTKIGTFIAALRKAQGMTQEQLAEKLGVSNRSVSRWENGNTLPDFSLMQTLAVVLNVSLAELLAGQRLPEDSKAEASIRLALELVQREKAVLRKALNRCFGFGVVLILCGVLFRSFTEVPQVFFLLCCGLGAAFIIAGFVINNRKATMISPSVLTADGFGPRMKRASELLHFSMIHQTGHQKQHRKAFEALSAALDNDEYAQYAFIADSCRIKGAPGPWHVAVAITGKRILLCGETMRGALFPVYPVSGYDRSNFCGADLHGSKLILYLQETEIQLDGHGFDAIADRLQSFISA